MPSWILWIFSSFLKSSCLKLLELIGVTWILVMSSNQKEYVVMLSIQVFTLLIFFFGLHHTYNVCHVCTCRDQKLWRLTHGTLKEQGLLSACLIFLHECSSMNLTICRSVLHFDSNLVFLVIQQKSCPLKLEGRCKFYSFRS